MFFSSVNTVTMSRLTTTKRFQIVQTIVQFGKPTVHLIQFKVDIIVHQSQLFYGRVWYYVLTRFSHLIIAEKKIALVPGFKIVVKGLMPQT